MPPRIDVYVWVDRADPAVLRRFVDRYVDSDDPGDDHFEVFERVHVDLDEEPDDTELLDELRRSDDSPVGVFSLYLNARRHDRAIVTLTAEGAAVLGVSVDDPDPTDDAPLDEARRLMADLRRELGARAAIGGTEIEPPQSLAEWLDAWPVQLRDGDLEVDPRD